MSEIILGIGTSRETAEWNRGSEIAHLFDHVGLKTVKLGPIQPFSRHPWGAATPSSPEVKSMETPWSPSFMNLMQVKTSYYWFSSDHAFILITVALLIIRRQGCFLTSIWDRYEVCRLVDARRSREIRDYTWIYLVNAALKLPLINFVVWAGVNRIKNSWGSGRQQIQFDRGRREDVPS